MSFSFFNYAVVFVLCFVMCRGLILVVMCLVRKPSFKASPTPERPVFNGVALPIRHHNTLCYALVLPGRKSSFRAGFRSDSHQENLKIGPPTGLRPAGVPFSRLTPTRIRPEFGPEARIPVREHYCETSGSTFQAEQVQENVAKAGAERTPSTGLEVGQAVRSRGTYTELSVGPQSRVYCSHPGRSLPQGHELPPRRREVQPHGRDFQPRG
jgi:hypothetical protein